MKEFFDYVAENIRGFSNERALIIGDSLTADIKGGMNAGIDTCWFNPRSIHNSTTIKPTYEIKKLEDLSVILTRN